PPAEADAVAGRGIFHEHAEARQACEAEAAGAGGEPADFETDRSRGAVGDELPRDLFEADLDFGANPARGDGPGAGGLLAAIDAGAGEAGQTMANILFVRRMDVARLAEIDCDRERGMRICGDSFAL